MCSVIQSNIATLSIIPILLNYKVIIFQFEAVRKMIFLEYNWFRIEVTVGAGALYQEMILIFLTAELLYWIESGFVCLSLCYISKQPYSNYTYT